MNKLGYEKVWFSLEQYLKDNTFGKPYLKTVPSKRKKEFSTVNEMYDTIMLEIQQHVNLYFNELFSHIDINILPINKVKLIQQACYSTFVSKLYGMLITDKNVKQSFSNNSGYVIEEEINRNSNHYLDIFTPSAIKALNQTQIKQLWTVYTTWKEVFAHIKDKNFDYIYTAAEIDELIEIIRIESENLFKEIATYVEDKLDKYKTELANDKELIDNISTSLVENEELVNKFEEKLETKFTDKLDNINEMVNKNKDDIESIKNNIESIKNNLSSEIVDISDFNSNSKEYQIRDFDLKIFKYDIWVSCAYQYPGYVRMNNTDNLTQIVGYDINSKEYYNISIDSSGLIKGSKFLDKLSIIKHKRLEIN